MTLTYHQGLRDDELLLYYVGGPRSCAPLVHHLCAAAACVQRVVQRPPATHQPARVPCSVALQGFLPAPEPPADCCAPPPEDGPALMAVDHHAFCTAASDSDGDLYDEEGGAGPRLCAPRMCVCSALHTRGWHWHWCPAGPHHLLLPPLALPGLVIDPLDGVWRKSREPFAGEPFAGGQLLVPAAAAAAAQHVNTRCFRVHVPKVFSCLPQAPRSSWHARQTASRACWQTWTTDAPLWSRRRQQGSCRSAQPCRGCQLRCTSSGGTWGGGGVVHVLFLCSAARSLERSRLLAGVHTCGRLTRCVQEAARGPCARAGAAAAVAAARAGAGAVMRPG